METPKYESTITLGNILTILAMVSSVVYSLVVSTVRFEDHVVLARKEHEQFVQKDVNDVWREYIVTSIIEIKSDIKDIKKAVK